MTPFSLVNTNVLEKPVASVLNGGRSNAIDQLLIFLSWIWRQQIPPKRRYLCTLRFVTSHITAVLMFTPWERQVPSGEAIH
jgi:hypothetical protein